MELIYTVVFGSCLILQISAFGKSGKAEVKGNVLFQVQLPNVLYQSIPKFTKDDTKDRITQHEIKLASDKKLLVKCVEDDYEAEAYIFSPGDHYHLIDRLKLFPRKDVCKQMNRFDTDFSEQPILHETYGHDKLMFTMSYKFNGEEEQCLKRRYLFSTFLYYAKFERGPVELTDCKKSFAEHLKNHEILLSSGSFGIMDFNKNLDSVGEPSIHTFNVPNLKLRCQTYTKKTKSGPIEDSTEAIGYIIYEDTKLKQDMIIEKLRLDSCEAGVNGMYIKEGITPLNTREFTLVFKTTDGQCYRSHLTYEPLRDKLKVGRSAPDRVNCPDVWTSDAALATKPPLYIRFLKFLGNLSRKFRQLFKL
ncbi:uncharacterized protein LOC128992410 [Macrosteles quadrilineatus]|uniref:uncharacterized protein LOC128992410 n=1 Tax=Macrosteles quadrilineatus TaxID=74068 RepID=UPI0023E335E1|nr:uncharacterized protein LOC128992410 [Macrosteles quadrilineatus]